MQLYACSSNRGKLAEFELAGGNEGIDIRPLPDLQHIDPPEETGVTFEENAVLKAVYYSRFTRERVFTDDSGLEVDSLEGAPGVVSARYAGPGATDDANNQLLLAKLANGLNRRARFVCVLALAQKGRLIFTTEGTVEGEILGQPRGAGGFGYDPLFFYPPLSHSFAELSPEVKLSVSHRGNALRKFFRKLEEYP